MEQMIQQIMDQLTEPNASREQDRAKLRTLQQQTEELRKTLANTQLPMPTLGTPQGHTPTSTSPTPTPIEANPSNIQPITGLAELPPRGSPPHRYDETETSKARRKPLPIGPPFNGDKAHFEAWKITITHKLIADQEFIGGAREQFAFIWANLGPKAQETVAPYYQVRGQSTPQTKARIGTATETWK